MGELVVYSLIMVCGSLIAAISQILLKKSAQKQYPNKLREYLNLPVIVAYALFFGTTFISMYALKVVPLSMAPILEASGYIFVAILSFIFLKEKMTKRQLAGMTLIVAGIVVYSLKLS